MEEEYKETDWSVTVKKVENGYVIAPSSTADGYRSSVVEENADYDELRAEQDALRNVFHYLSNYFNVNNIKHENDGEGQYLDITVTGDEE